MAQKFREEVVGKRFLSVKSPGKLKISKISEWEWRSGVVRAVSSRETTSPEFSILVEFDGEEWKRREWIKVHEAFQVLLVEHTLVWVERPDPDRPRSPQTYPALFFKPLVDKAGLTSSKRRPVEFLLDRELSIEEEKELKYYKEGDEDTHKAALCDPDIRRAVKGWLDYQDGQKILLTTPTVLCGYRVEVYRTEGTTQWYTAFIKSYDPSTTVLAVTDDTVLEEHYEDPALTQMRIIEDGVIDAILRGEQVSQRRRPTRNANYSGSSHTGSSTFSGSKEQQAHFTRRHNPQPSTPASPGTKPPAAARCTKATSKPNSASGASEPEKERPAKSKPSALRERKRRIAASGESLLNSPRKRQNDSENLSPDPEAAGSENTSPLGDAKERVRASRDSSRVSQDKSRVGGGDEEEEEQQQQPLLASEDRSRVNEDTLSRVSEEEDSGSREESSKESSGGGGGGGGGSNNSRDSWRPPLLPEGLLTPSVVLTKTTSSSGHKDRPPKSEQKSRVKGGSARSSKAGVDSGSSGSSSSSSRKPRKERSKASSGRVLAPSSSCDVSAGVGRTESPECVTVPEGNASQASSPRPDLLADPVTETEGCKPEVAVAAVSEDTMHYKKHHLLSGNTSSASSGCGSNGGASSNNNNSSSSGSGGGNSVLPSSSSPNQPSGAASITAASNSSSASARAVIDVTRSVTEQIKFAKIPLSGNGQPESRASPAMAQLSAAEPLRALHEVSHERTRESSAFTSVQPHAGLPRSNANTPANSEERADSRASDSHSRSSYEERIPAAAASRLEDSKSSLLKGSSSSSSPYLLSNSSSSSSDKLNFDPVDPYRDPELMRKSNVQSSVQNLLVHAPAKTMSGSFPAVHTPVPTAPPAPGIAPSPTTLPSHPGPGAGLPGRPAMLTPLPYQMPPHSLAASMSPHLMAAQGYPASLEAAATLAAARQQQQQHHLAALQYAPPMIPPHSALYPHAAAAAAGARSVDMLWQQKFGHHHWPLLANSKQEELLGLAVDPRLREREREHLERERELRDRERLAEFERQERERQQERMDRERREKERKERLERERLEKEKAEREKAERERLERLERERAAEKERQERQERERLEEIRRAREQRQEQQDRILRGAVDNSKAAVDQHFTESLRRASQKGMWPSSAPSITKGTGKGLVPKSEYGHPGHSSLAGLPLVHDKTGNAFKREEERSLKREMEHREQERHAEMNERLYSSSMPKDMKTEPRGTQGGGDSKQSGYYLYNFPNSPGMSHYMPPATTASTGSSAPVKQEGMPLFQLYGYQPSHQPTHSHMVTAEQLQRQGLKPKEEKPSVSAAMDSKMRYASPVPHQAPSPRPKESPHLQHMKEMTQSSVIVENKASRMESPHYASSRVSPASSPRPQPRPAHTPEHRPDRPHSSSGAHGHPPGSMHPVMAHSMGPGGLQPSHPTAFRAPDNKHGIHRSPSPYLPSSSSQSQPYPSASSIPQPIDYCKSSSSKLKAASNIPSTGSPGTVATTLPQPPVSLAPSTPSNCSFSLIQQGLVPNPIYSQGLSFSASKPTSVQLAKGAPPSNIPSLNPLGPSSAHSGGGSHPSPMAQQTQQQHHLLQQQQQFQQQQQQQPQAAGGGAKKRSIREGGGASRKRQKAGPVDNPPTSNPGLHPSAHPGNPHPGQHLGAHPVPVTTPQIMSHPSPLTTITSTYNRQSNGSTAALPMPPSGLPGGQGGPTSASLASGAAAGVEPGVAVAPGGNFLDSFKSFVESTVQAAFMQDEKMEKGNNRVQDAAGSQQQQQQQQHPHPASAPGEKMEVTTASPTTNEDTNTSINSRQMSSIMETINRVANGQLDTDSDTLSAPSPPPSTSQPDASPAAKSAHQANHPKLKKFWLKRHSDEDKEKGKPSAAPAQGQEDNVGSSSNGSKANSSNGGSGGGGGGGGGSGSSSSSTSSGGGGGDASSQEERKPVGGKMEEASTEECTSSAPSPAPSSSLANGVPMDVQHNDESTSSASEGETQPNNSTQSKKRTKSKKAPVPAKKLKTEEAANPPVRKKPAAKKSKEGKDSNKEGGKDTGKDKEKSKPQWEDSPPASRGRAEEKAKVASKAEESPEPPTSEPESIPEAPLPSSKDKKKNRRGKEPPKETDKNSSNFNKPLVKMTMAMLKKTCTPFIQDGSCSEITPKLAKCRECKMTPTQRSKKLPNIFCRFYAFRRLRYSPRGTVTISGFSELSDADPDDIEPWLPKFPVQEPALDVETSKFIIAKVGDKFCELVEQEKQTKASAGEDAKIAWKRAVTGVREMCDVCDTTLFNMHWVCHKCGFVVCLDCYNVRVKAADSQDGRNGSKKKDDEHRWLTCSSNRQAHEAEKLMLTQIIPSDALWELGRLIHDIRRKWSIPAKCPCGQSNIEAQILNKNGVTQIAQEGKKKLVNGLGDDHGKPGKSGKKNRHGDAVNGAIKTPRANNPLEFLADVVCCNTGESNRDSNDSSSGKGKSEQSKSGEPGSPDPESDEKKTSCSTLRELLTKTASKAKGQGGENNKKAAKNKAAAAAAPAPAPSLALNDIIQSVVEKSCRDEVAEPAFKFIHYIPRLGNWQKDSPTITTHNLRETSLLYPDVPHSWLCEGRLLRLHAPHHRGNLKIFQEQWKCGQPVLVSKVDSCMNKDIWRPEAFGKEFGHLENDLVNCRNGNVIMGNPMIDFWEGFESIEKRQLDDNEEPMLWKLKDWPPGDDFSDVLPSRFQDLMQALPLPEYTHRQGKLNLASRLPDFLVRPDLGPKMYNAYGSANFPKEGTTNLHLDISDAVNVMVYVGIPTDAGGRQKHQDAALKAIDDAGCDSVTKRRVRESHEIPGALWQIFHAPDADKIRDFLNKVAKERGETVEPNHDPIHDQSWYLDEELRDRLYKEYDVQGYTIVQCLGDAIFIPAGAPHQVRNLHSCIKVAEDFVSPEHLNHCFLLTQEFRQLSNTHSNHEDKLQVKNIIYHAVKDALAVLRDKVPEES